MKNYTRRSTNLSISLPSEMQEVLRQAAFDDNRTVSSLIAALVDSYLIREGYILPEQGLRIRPLPVQTRLDMRQMTTN
mgnify:CR=1 FL=1|jgi:hypothetical protein